MLPTGAAPLILSNVNFLAMDWKNMEKCRPYVIVQSKSLVRGVTLNHPPIHILVFYSCLFMRVKTREETKGAC